MPGLIVFVWLVDHFSKRIKLLQKAPLVLAIGTAIAAILGLTQAIRLQSTSYSHLGTPSGALAYLPAPIIDGRYKFLLANTKPGDMVYEAYQPYIYFPLLLRNPTKYGQIWDTDYTRPEHITETIEALMSNPPRYILWNNNYNKTPDTRGPGDHIGPLSDSLLQHYSPVGEVVDIPEGKIQVWERRN